jgi:hypothetical protein
LNQLRSPIQVSNWHWNANYGHTEATRLGGLLFTCHGP